MSRRTKLTITTTFLVLLAIPGVYLVLTWSPPSPLRFHEVPDTSAHDGQSTKGRKRYELAVENTTPVAIHLISVRLESSDDLARGRAEATEMSSHEVIDRGTAARIIPPGCTVRIGYRYSRHFSQAPEADSWVHYLWVSRTKNTALHVRNWLAAHTPASLERFLPHIPAEYDGIHIIPALHQSPDGILQVSIPEP